MYEKFLILEAGYKVCMIRMPSQVMVMRFDGCLGFDMCCGSSIGCFSPFTMDIFVAFDNLVRVPREF